MSEFKINISSTTNNFGSVPDISNSVCKDTIKPSLFMYNDDNSIKADKSYDNNEFVCGDNNFTKNNDNKIPKKREKELKSWTLDFDFVVDKSELSSLETDTPKSDKEKEEMILNYHKEENKELYDIYDTWYQEYLKKNNNKEMNFLSAMQYLKDNPDEKPEIKEFIRKCFGICDGDVANNKQMGLGTCHLLSTREKLADDSRLNYIVENIVNQNDDGTVTVTFFGIKVQNDNNEYEPIQFKFKNEEIKAAYINLNAENDYYGGSTDPDSAVLEMAYKKFSQILNEKYPIPKDEVQTPDDIKKKISETEFFYKYNDGCHIDKMLLLLTGLGNFVEEYYNVYDIDNYFKSINYDVTKRCVVAHKFQERDDDTQELLADHEYMIKEIYKDDKGKKYIVFKNPHNREYDIDEIPSDNIIDGNAGNTFTVPYNNSLLQNLYITTILDEPIENKKQYYVFPDDFIYQ